MDFFKFFILPNLKSPKKSLDVKWDTCSTFFTQVVYKNQNDDSKSVVIELEKNSFYDIVQVYKRVITLLDKKVEDASKLSSSTRLKWIIENSTDAKEIRMAKDQLFILNQKSQMQDLKTVFKKRAEGVIKNFMIACQDSATLYFDKRVLCIDAIKKKEQQEILETFLSICQEYVPVKTSNKGYISTSCCDNPKIISDYATIYCDNCQTTFTDIDHSGNFNDQKRTSTSSKPKHYNIKHFVTAIKKSQGIHKKIIDPIVDIKQDEYMLHHKIKLEDYTIFHLRDLLQRDSSLSSYYKDIHLIYRQKTGKQINNLSNIERELPKWYKEQDQLSEQIKLKNSSKNSINAYYMVCRLCQIHGRIDLKLENFFCARDTETILEYDKCFEKKCKVLGWLKPNESLNDYCQ
jgi:hypothetical protein